MWNNMGSYIHPTYYVASNVVQLSIVVDKSRYPTVTNLCPHSMMTWTFIVSGTQIDVCSVR